MWKKILKKYENTWEYRVIISKNKPKVEEGFNIFPLSLVYYLWGTLLFALVLTFLGSFGGAEWLPIPSRVESWGNLEFLMLPFPFLP